ncbi:circularly permuted type 2 ATP-grasp protein [Paucibacter sp. R3-3]|uniref:Circularly permuted type 2 ATP-grasp protein n=1 Tax=Roseateles agri TaxID=3098619 RepID=A0ABU5DEH8_9BURK|nr:circularly permuted type 2 ATP-grasp protein [Paucibacter sp. R3-3]MDY0744168.1 circularly permuted type 2 ATP-grasp protein [Paucibacter sp. R3-3]
MTTPPAPLQSSLLADEESPDAAALAAASTLRGKDGHYSELHGQLNKAGGGHPPLSPLWREFFAATGVDGWQDLGPRAQRTQRRIQEDGASYNVYDNAHEGGGQSSRVWPLELLPMLISAQEWQHIEAGVIQRAKLLNAALADVYGPRRLLDEGLLPASLVFAHPQYLRPMHGVVPLGGVHLHVLAFDLARGADGLWWIVGQRTQAPSGLGYVLENRLIIAEQFPEAFRSMAVQRLAGSFQTLLQGLTRLSPEGERSRVALLTPGPRNETYFEHTFLARYLGITLVEGGDLTVREDKVYLKTTQGLERVHVLLRRVDDNFLDPLELRSDSALGVPGLVQAMRAGQIVVANTPGSGWLESPGLSAFWPGVAKELLDEELLLPDTNAWWCGEAAAWNEYRDELDDFVVAPTFPSSETTRGFAPSVIASLAPAARAALLARVAQDPAAHTLQARIQPSETPVWNEGSLEPRPAVVRVFAVADGRGSWTVLPGGLTRVATHRSGAVGGRGRDDPPDPWLSMQQGSASIDTWVLTEGKVDRTSLLAKPLSAADLKNVHWTVTSRSAENLFWLGRYTERAENSVRLARLTLDALTSAARGSTPPEVLRVLDAMARRYGLVGESVPSAEQSLRVFERSLVRSLADTLESGSVAWNLRALQNCAQSLRERLSSEHWKLIHEVGDDFTERMQVLLGYDFGAPSSEVTGALARVDTQLAAITGAQTDRMTRDDGWRLLSVGRQLERLDFFANALIEGFAHRLHLKEEGFALLLGLFDSTITYRAQFQGRREVPPLLHLLVHDTDNPRSLAWVARTLRERFLKLSRHDHDWALEQARGFPQPEYWSLEDISRADEDGSYSRLSGLLNDCSARAMDLSVQIGRRLFNHVGSVDRMVWQ